MPAAQVLEAFAISAESLEPAPRGLINASWYARTAEGRALVLQHLNPIFSARVNRDIDVVTRHLLAKGVLVPQVVPTVSGELWHEHRGEVWRALTRIEGVGHEATEHTGRAREAGRVLGEFHRGVHDLEHEFENQRLGVHDTAKHLRALTAAVEALRGHSEHARVAALAADIGALAAELPALPSMPDRIVHGDPKIANILFGPETDRAICFIDLDTLGRMPIVLELGDALRSWCNPASEEAAQATFSVELFEAAIAGYAEQAGGWLTAEEWQAIPAGTLTIAVELAARFAADALHESYFRFDTKRYEHASQHNQARARGQLAVARAIAARLATMQDMVTEAFRNA